MIRTKAASRDAGQKALVPQAPAVQLYYMRVDGMQDLSAAIDLVR